MSITEQGNDVTSVDIDTRGMDEGEFDLTLESFNTRSIAQSALKTDKIKIIITLSTSTLPSFSEEPSV